MRRQQVIGAAGLRRLAAAGASVALVGGICAFGVTQLAASASATTAADQSSSCQLGNGIQHVVQIGFDNTHFFRDNPNVPSDLEMMPNLLNFIEGSGVMLSNSHTPLIAHTSIDLLTTATGLYGDRQGVGSGDNAFETYNPDGTTDPTTAFTYWTDPIDDTATPPTAGHDANPNMVYSPVPPATASSPVSPTSVTPAPWASYTRAGCNVGEIATANQELENPAFDVPQAFGAGSPEANEVAADLKANPNSFLDPETAEYVGIAVHCAQGSSFCADATAVKTGQTSPSNTAVADVLPDEPGGYGGYQVLFGHKYVAPQLGAGQASLTHNGYEVTNAAGNLVDLNGNQINGAFLSTPGFPGYSHINAAQSLAYAADMLENGVPVVNIYMSDIHGNESIPGLTGAGQPCFHAPAALPPGTACYAAQGAYYNAAFGTFFKRLALDGITPQNTLFVVSSDEGDHVVGANVGRALQPQPLGCDGVTTLCNYPAASSGQPGYFGELSVNANGLLAEEAGVTTPFSFIQDTSPQFFLEGNPGPGTPTVRAFEHGVAGLTADDPYTGNANQPLTLDLANPVEESILHMTDADPARTATLAMFANPDYFLSPSTNTTCVPSGLGGCVTQTTGFAYDHGAYAAEINTNYVGFVGPGVKNLGLDGPAANAGATSSGPDSGLITVADTNFPGPWVDETDIRPTMMYLTGLKDDYEHDGRVITQILATPNSALADPAVTSLGECYKQLNSSVGAFGAATLTASTNAIESTSSGDHVFKSVDSRLATLEVTRDQLAGQIKGELEAAAFDNQPIPGAGGQRVACQAVIDQASHIASSS
jgi:hypothetical protein